MRSLLRTIIRAGTQSGWRDQLLSGDRLGIGRGSDQEIQLADPAVALHHAVVELGLEVRVRALRDCDIWLNEKPCRQARFDIGDTLSVGACRLQRIAPTAPDIDFALTLESRADATQATLQEGAFQTRLTAVAWLRQRAFAWLALLLVLALGFCLPMLAARDPHWRGTLGDVRLPDDGAWSAGPLHEQHAFIGADCHACHEQPFARVANRACAACHSAVAAHADPARFRLAAFAGQRCEDCHHEHNEAPTLIRDDQQFCASCHRDIHAAGHGGATLDLRNASDFGTDHPPLRLSLLRYDGQQWSRTARTELTPSLREQSHLEFSHAKHMDSAGIRNDRGVVEALACSQCHEVEMDGMRMRPIRMEQHCERCHTLDFDITAPGRTVPHGEPQHVLDSLRDFYSRRFIEQARQQREVRQPGPEATDRLRKEGIAWVEGEVSRAARDLFERRACATCHEVSVVRDSGAQPRWRVTPVSLSGYWFPAANFSHATHANAPCSRCHAAAGSKTADDILAPSIATCRECHAGAGSVGKSRIASGCIECHRFHRPAAGPMVPGATMRAAAATLPEAAPDARHCRDAGGVTCAAR